MVELKNFLLTEDNRFSFFPDAIKSIGEDAFKEYFTKVYRALDSLRPGRHYNIIKDVPADKQELFVKICHLYTFAHPNYDFDLEITKIHHYQS